MVLLLVPERQASELIRGCVLRLAQTSTVKDHLLISIGLLARKAKLSVLELNRLAKGDSNKDVEHRLRERLVSAFALAQGRSVRSTRRALLTLMMLLGENAVTAHSGFTRLKVGSSSCYPLTEIARDLRLICQALSEIDPSIITGLAYSSFDIEECATAVSHLETRLTMELEGQSQNSRDKILAEARAVLFVRSSIAPSFQNAFFNVSLMSRTLRAAP
ncbi:MAG: hypothetical protein IPJ28_01300 [Betaproteobacteria bacterium]|nr:hypothetical protein [Betaproteobacteria bacterium]